MKTISIRLEDSIYDELGELLDSMGQTKQTFYETYTRTAIREGGIPFMVKGFTNASNNRDKKFDAFLKLEELKKEMKKDVDYEKNRSEAMKEKYGSIG